MSISNVGGICKEEEVESWRGERAKIEARSYAIAKNRKEKNLRHDSEVYFLA